MYDNNILIDKNKKIWIIDWGNTTRGNIVRDFSKKYFDKKSVFNEVVHLNNIQSEIIYSYDEHLFIDEFLEVAEMIKKAKKKNSIYKMRIDYRMRELYRMSLRLSKQMENS